MNIKIINPSYSAVSKPASALVRNKGSVFLMVASLLLGGCNAFTPVTPDFSSLNHQPSSNETVNYGELVWIDMLSTDVPEAQQFYSALFNWEYHTNDSGYVTIVDNGKPIGGMLTETHVDANSRWMPMFLIADAEQSSEKALQMMGSLPTPPAKITQNMTYAVISDLEGAAFGVMSSPKGITNTSYSAQIIDAQLWSHDRQKAFRFYQPLFSLKQNRSTSTHTQSTPIQMPETKAVSYVSQPEKTAEKSSSAPQMRRMFAAPTTESSKSDVATSLKPYVKPSIKKDEPAKPKPEKLTFGVPKSYNAAQTQFGIDLSMNMTQLPWEAIPAQWVVSFKVSRADEVLSQVMQNGGKILVNMNDPLSDGTVAVIEDPRGAVFMIQASTNQASNRGR